MSWDNKSSMFYCLQAKDLSKNHPKQGQSIIKPADTPAIDSTDDWIAALQVKVEVDQGRMFLSAILMKQFTNKTAIEPPVYVL